MLYSAQVFDKLSTKKVLQKNFFRNFPFLTFGLVVNSVFPMGCVSARYDWISTRRRPDKRWTKVSSLFDVIVKVLETHLENASFSSFLDFEGMAVKGHSLAFFEDATGLRH